MGAMAPNICEVMAHIERADMVAYTYKDASGRPTNRVIKENGKTRQEFWNGATWLRSSNGHERTQIYNLPELISARSRGETVWSFEGESDCDAAREKGVVAVCSLGGAGKWSYIHAREFQGCARVHIGYDNDDIGRRDALERARTFKELGIPYDFVETLVTSVGSDLRDHLNAGYRFDDLIITRRGPKVVAKPKFTVEKGPSHNPPAIWYLLTQHVLDKARPSGDDPNQWTACCPAHEDAEPSLSLRLGDVGDSVGIMIECRADCTFDEIKLSLEEKFGLNGYELSRNLFTEEAGALEADAPDHLTRAQATEFRRQRDRLIAREALAESMMGRRLSGELSTFDEVIARSKLKPKYSIEYLAQADANILLTAEQKTGKTRLALSFCKAFCDDEPFLGYFPITAPASSRILYIDYEMNDAAFGRWLGESGIKNGARFRHRGAKGLDNPFWLPSGRDWLVEQCLKHKVWCIIWDTMLVASMGLVENTNSDMDWARFQKAIDDVKELSGVSVCLLLHHMGKEDKEHARGSMRIEDWPDALWYLRAGSDASDDREFTARGRDVAFEGGSLLYDDGTGLYRYGGLSPREAADEKRLKSYITALCRVYHSDMYWPHKTAAVKLPRGNKDARMRICALAVARGFVLEVADGRATKCVVTDTGREWVDFPSVGP